MQAMLDPVERLLRNNGMRPEDIDLITMTNLFLGQMRVGLYGGAATIGMEPTYLTSVGAIPQSKPVAVVEVDEREVRAGLVTLTPHGPVVERGESFPVPGGAYPAPWEDLIFAVAELVTPFLQQTELCCFCLPFPMQKTPGGDGIVVRMPASLDLHDWQGKRVGQSLTQELESRGMTGKQVIPLHTAGAVQMSGRIVQPEATRAVGLSWGDDINVSFSAPGTVMLKVGGADSRLLLVDTDSSGFTGVPIGAADLILDRDCANPGQDLYRKMVSMWNLGDIYRLTVIKGVEAGLLTFGCGRDFLSLRKLSISSVETFLQEPEGENKLAVFCQLAEDRTVALTVAEAVLKRAVRLVCANVAATLLVSGAGRDAQHPVCLCAAGEAFRIPQIRTFLEEELHAFLQEQLGLFYTFQIPEDAVFVGAAVTALLNQNESA